MKIKIPDEALHIINRLEKCGFEAYVVGGCVRDSVLGAEPKDWDICTAALPEQTVACFKDHRIIETGLKYGTVTLLMGMKPYEITTYRVDGEYLDNRRPDTVEFVNDLRRDLSRRDFTINAMAYSPKTGIIDFFGGMEDARSKTIRCVGDADKRFQEDALRIMRGLRFAATLGFSIENETSASIIRNKGLLRKIAPERIAGELSMLVAAKNVSSTLTQYMPVVEELIPELTIAGGLIQDASHQCNQPFFQPLKNIDYAPSDAALRLTMLFHCFYKPACYSEMEGAGFFSGQHSQMCADTVKAILLRLKYDNATAQTVSELMLYYDADIQPGRISIKRWLNRIGEERLRQLLEIKRAETMALSEKHRCNGIAALDKVAGVIDNIIEQRLCFSLADLAVNGDDMISAGIPEGAKIGEILNRLLEMVIDEDVENEKELLLEATRLLSVY